jgi:hypothetical protein
VPSPCRGYRFTHLAAGIHDIVFKKVRELAHRESCSTAGKLRSKDGRRPVAHIHAPSYKLLDGIGHRGYLSSAETAMRVLLPEVARPSDAGWAARDHNAGVRHRQDDHPS